MLSLLDTIEKEFWGKDMRRDYMMREDDDKFVIAVLMPGVTKENLKVTLENNLLKLEGKVRTWYDEYNYHKEFSLGSRADVDKVGAKLENGVLEITIPKLGNKKKIEVKLE